MLEEILAFTDGLEFEESGWATITAAHYDDSDLIVRLTAGKPSVEARTYEIRCRAPRMSRILAAAHSDSIHLNSDHVLLWPHVQPNRDLYISNKAVDANGVYRALIERHLETFDEWFPVTRFLNHHSLMAILSSGYGQVASGPEEIIRRYASVLDESGIHHSSPSGFGPVWWNAEQRKWIPECEQLYVLRLGESYVVAPEFSERITFR